MTPELLDTLTSIFSNVVTGITAIVVAIVAIKGLRAWRQELRGKAQYEAVRQVMTLARRFRAEFKRSRGVMTWSSEYVDRPRGENETPEQARVLDARYARLGRLQPAADVLVELEQAAWEAEVATGEDIIPLLSPFGEVVRELNIAILQHFEMQLAQANRPPMSAPLPEPGGDFVSQLELIYQPGEDELTQRVDDALAELEKQLKKYIR